MSDVSAHPSLSGYEVPIDSWTQPFWDATATRKLVLPRCADCDRFRWPPGPFCPGCHSQRVEWVPAGDGQIYSFTIITKGDGDQHQVFVPALIEFPEAGGLRLVAAIVETPLAAVRIGARVELSWSHAANATVPVFKIVTL
ncbi:MAG: acyl dehydratase [Rhodospirillaceae bacterium]|nr:MAG: acyl dehydratase [Rhodospirillaceae bacterium]